METLSTKMSGLQIDTEYSFYLVLKTSGGTYTSNTLTVKTHTMNNLTGITVTPGVLPPQLRESLEVAIERIGARMNETVKIDTTHFVCTEGRGRDWERASEMNIPVVRPEWIEGCEREGKIIGVRGYYLDANPKDRQVGSNPALTQQARHSVSAQGSQQASIPQRPKELPQSPDRESTVSGEPGPEVLPSPNPQKDLPPTPTAVEEEVEEDDDDEEVEEEHPSTESKGKGKAVDDEPHDHDGDADDDDDEDETSTDHNHTSGLHEGKGTEMEDVAL
jgi:chitin biosynthesis protein CHS5